MGRERHGHLPRGIVGVKDQQPAVYSPKTKLLYVLLKHVCMDYEPVEVK